MRDGLLHIAASAAAGETVFLSGEADPVQLEVLIPGPALTARPLILTAPISFWGGVDPKTSEIADVRHPQHGMEIDGTILMLPGTIGSSSASAILLELIHRGIAPAAIIMNEPDAILLLGVIVAREMGWKGMGAYRGELHRPFMTVTLSNRQIHPCRAPKPNAGPPLERRRDFPL